MNLDRTQRIYIALIVGVLLAGTLVILFLLGVLTDSDDATPQPSISGALSSKTCTSISTYESDAAGGAADIVSFDSAKARFGQLVGGSNAGSFLAFFDDDEEKSADPAYTFFARNVDGNYVRYASSVLTWALPGESESVSPIFSTDPRYIMFSANGTSSNGTSKAELQITFVQPVWCVALQRIDFSDRQIRAVAWLGTRLEFLVLLDGGEIRHYVQEVTHHWVVRHTFTGQGDTDLVATSENRIFHCDDTNGSVIERLYDAAADSWSVVGTTIATGGTVTRLSASVDALWLAVQLSTGSVVNFLRGAVTDAAFAQLEGSLTGNGPMAHYLNTRLVVGNNDTIQSFVRSGEEVAPEDEPIQSTENIVSDFVVTQLAVQESTNLVIPSTAGTPQVLKATCT